MSHPPSNAPRSSGGYARPTSNSAGHATKGQQNVSRQNKASTGSGTSQTNPDAAKPKRQIVGQYMIGRTIGEGTFGKVKLAVHIPTGEKVAIKILEKGRIKEQADVRRVNREIKILKKTRHGNIIQLFEVLDTKSSIYLIMECAEGGEMFDFIVAQKRVEEVQACKFFHQIVDGIEVLHNNEITHRDLKPENLLLKATPDGWVVKIVDFGLSNTHEGGKYLSTACGSPCYAAPEMIASKKYFGPLADLWSVGVILFALVSGYLPFEDPNTSVLYKKILAGDYTTPKWLSPEVKDLIDCILEVDPRRRYTIKDIRQHVWYRKVSPDQVPQDDITSTNEASKQETLVIMENAGMSAQSVLDGIASHAFNSLTAMYYLLEQKHRARRLQKAHSGSNKISIRQNSSNLSKPETGSDAGGASSVGAAAAAGAQKQQQEQHIQQSSNKENVTSKQKNEHQAAATGAEKTVTGSTTTTTTTNGAKDSNRNGAKTNKPIVPSGLKLMSGSNSSASKSPTATAGAAGVTKAGAVDNNNGPKSSHVPMTPYLQAPRMIQQRAAASTAAAGDSSDAVASGGGGGGGDAVASSAGNNSGSQQKQRQGSGSSSRSNNSNKNAVIDINNDRKRHSIGGNGSAGGSISNNSATSKPTKPSGGVSIPPLNLRAVKGTGDGSGASSNRSTSAAMAAATGSSVLRASKPTGTTAGGAAGNTAPKYAVSQTARPAVGSSTGAGAAAAAAAVVGTGSNSQQPQQQQQQQHRNKAQLVPITSTAPTPAAGAGAPLPATKPTSQLMPVRRPSAGVAPATAGRNPTTTTTTATTTGAGLVVGASAGTGGNRRASSSSNPTGSSSSSGNHEHSSTNSTSNSSSNAPPPQQASSSSNKMTPVAPSAPKSSAAAVAASAQQSSTGSTPKGSSTGSTPKGSSTTMPKTNVLSDGNATGSGALVAIAAGGRRGRNLVATTAAAVPDNSAAVES